MVFIVESKPLNPGIHSFTYSFNKWLMGHLLCVRHTGYEEAALPLRTRQSGAGESRMNIYTGEP